MTSNGLGLSLNGSGSSATFLLSSVRNRKLFERITYNFPPDLYFFCWKGYLDFKKQDLGLYFEEYKRKHVVFQTLFNLSRIKLGNRTIDLFDPPTPGKKARTHEILYQEFPMTQQGKAIWRMAEEDGLWKKILQTPKTFLLTTSVFTEYFNYHYFFDEEAQIKEYQTRLEVFKQKMEFLLPNEGEIVFDDNEPYHFMSFNYIDSNKNLWRLLKGAVSFLRATLYCGECHQLNHLYFSLDDLKVHYRRGDEYHYLCYHGDRPSFMFFIKPDFTKLRHVNKRSGKTVDLSNSVGKLTVYKLNHIHVAKQKSKFKYIPPKVHREVEIVSLGRIYEVEVLKFAYKKNDWFSQEQLVNHLISKRGITQKFHSLSKSDKNYNFQMYDEMVSRVVDWLYRCGCVDFSLVPQKGAQKRYNRKSRSKSRSKIILIAEHGKQFWNYLVEEYGAKGQLTSQIEVFSAYRKFIGPQTFGGSFSGICIVFSLITGFIVFLLVMDFLSSFL